MSMQNQKVPSADQIGLLAVSDAVQHLKGTTATVIAKPSNDKSILVLMVEEGNFRYTIGDTTSTIGNTDPSASVTNGSGSVKITKGAPVAFAAPTSFTARGYTANDILTYWWL